MVLGLQELLDRERRSGVLIVLIIATVGLYTFVVHTKLAIYILPIFPALAILTARLFIMGASGKPSMYLPYLIAGGLATTVIAQNKVLLVLSPVALGLFLVFKIRRLNPQHMPVMLAALLFGIFAMIGTLDDVQGNNRLSIWPVYGIHDQPVAQIATLAGQHNPSTDEPLIGFNPQDHDRLQYSAVEGPAAIFYSNRPVQVAEDWDQLIALMQEQGSGDIIIAENYVEALSAEFNITVIETVHPLVYAEFSE
jgi:hypothetical protein